MHANDRRPERGGTAVQRIIGTGVTLLLVMWIGTAALAQGAPAAGSGAAILPGQAIGTFHLGQDVTQVVTTLGPIHSEDDIPGSSLTGYYWPLKRIGAIADKTTNKVVALIVSLDDGYRTDKGVSAGTDMDSVRSAYGKEDRVDSHEDDDTLVYDTLGVAFLVDKDGALGSRVSAIFVFASGQYKNIFEQDDDSGDSGGS
jgi:hypothetical protein